MRFLPFILCLLASEALIHPAAAQEKNPLINSGQLIARGSDLYDSGEYKESIQLYSRIDRNDTNYVRALYELALSCYADSQFSKSAHYCELAFAAENAFSMNYDPEIYDEYGNAVDAGGNPQRALSIFDSAIRKYPDYAYLYLNKGTVLLKLNRDKEAEQLFQQTLLMDPYAYTCHFKLGIVALRQGKLIPGMLCLIGYLLMNPEGKYHSSCINVLSSIAKNEDEIQQYINNRKEQPSESYQLLEQIIQSKIALDKNYKPITHLDDPISRQIQVLFEKLKYEEGSKDFYMQYYMPWFSQVFASNRFELFINQLFSSVDMPLVRNFLKKNKKEISALTADAGNYFNVIRSTREIVPGKRNMNGTAWYFSEGKLVGKGRATPNGEKLLGPWEFYYEYGNSKARGSYSENGLKEGPWLYYFFDGKLKGKEIYQNGKQQGEETYYTHDGLVSSHSWYKDNQLDGESTSFFATGGTHIIDHYVAGKEDGEKRIFYPGGALSLLIHYKAGKEEGEIRSWNQDGSLDYVAAYRNDKLEGPYTKYFDNGKIASSGVYSLDQQTGPWKYFYENGKLKEEETFVAGKAEGLLSHYYENGQLEYSYASKKGKADGEEKFYDEDGKLYSTHLLDNDRLVNAKFMDKGGKIISQDAESRQKQIVLNSFNAAGVKKLQVSYDEHGNTQGKKTYFYADGTISQTENYKDGDLDGPMHSFYPDGAAKDDYTYTHGVKDGYTVTRYVHGQVKAEGWYTKNEAQGYWLYYNELGNLTDSIYYLADDMNGLRGQFWPNGKKQYETEYRGGWVSGTTEYDSNGAAFSHVSLPAGTGRYTLNFPNGAVFLDANYVHGHLEGVRKTWFFDGKPSTEEYFRNGLQDSVEKGYNHFGKQTAERWYHAGDKTGKWKFYGDDGKLVRTEEYREGEMNGKRIYYFPNGSKEEEDSVKDGDLEGTLKKYDPSGALLYQLTYKHGTLTGYTYSDKNGHLMNEIPIVGESGRIKAFFSNGNPSADIGFRNGNLDGPFALYYLNGKIRNQSSQHIGLTEGPLKTYYDNGQIRHDYIYLHDNLQGHYKEYNEKGILTEEGDNYNGSPHGIVRYFDDNGKPIESDTFYYGTLLSVKK
jgi:antitoxin component YwqK of YwqJK toxin-antitoxin module/Tfp pilus assembly protein PilF